MFLCFPRLRRGNTKTYFLILSAGVIIVYFRVSAKIAKKEWRKIHYTVEPEFGGIKAGHYLRKIKNISARTLSKLKRVTNGVTRNGSLLKTTDTLFTGDEIRLRFPTDENRIIPIEGSLDILYEDEYIIAVNKPPGMPVHPTKLHQTNTLANILTCYQRNNCENYTIRIINRLDKDTSGVVVVAKNRHVAGLLRGSLKKEYFAVAQGRLETDGVINSPIKVQEGKSIQRVVANDGASAVTHYKIISYVAPINRPHTLLKIHLETGRTHQIRCHMSSIGHPLAGDDMYGGSLELISRQALHCNMAKFTHPEKYEEIVLKAEIPEDFKEFKKK